MTDRNSLVREAWRRYPTNTNHWEGIRAAFVAGGEWAESLGVATKTDCNCHSSSPEHHPDCLSHLKAEQFLELDDAQQLEEYERLRNELEWMTKDRDASRAVMRDLAGKEQRLRALLKEVSDDISEPSYKHHRNKYWEVQMTPSVIEKLRAEVGTYAV